MPGREVDYHLYSLSVSRRDPQPPSHARRINDHNAGAERRESGETCGVICSSSPRRCNSNTAPAATVPCVQRVPKSHQEIRVEQVDHYSYISSQLSCSLHSTQFRSVLASAAVHFQTPTPAANTSSNAAAPRLSSRPRRYDSGSKVKTISHGPDGTATARKRKSAR
jgi:hypothetical protein